MGLLVILADYHRGSHELIPDIIKAGVPASKADLIYGDYAFEGYGPKGPILVGVERKTLHDMLSCIDSAHFTGKQMVGMKKMYGFSFLLVEGLWRAHEDGWLMEGFPNGSWGYCKQRTQRVMYSKLRRYLVSITLAGTPVIYTRDQKGTAYDLCELFHYFQKTWNKHASLLEMHKLNIAQLSGKPSVTRRWAESLDGVGSTYGMEADRIFKTPYKLAASTEQDWLRIAGIGPKTARKIIREIHG